MGWRDEVEDELDRAAELGVGPELAEFVSGWLDAAERAADGYDAAHWGDDYDAVEIVDLSPLPASLYELGELVRVEYDTRKGGEDARYFHDFESERPTLAVDPETERLHVVGGDYRVTERGIVG